MGSETYETDAPSLAAGDTHYCAQMQSVSLGDGAGASLSLTNQGAFAQTIHRLGNLVWLDDGDGVADLGESGIDGVTVELWRDGADEALATTTTSDDGAYLFEGLLCGTYRVVIPGGQDGWTIGGDPVDPATLRAVAVNNPDANDDADNDNNAVVSDAGFTSGPVEIGDCGEDGDFTNSASNEPTDETDRVGGPDDDPDDVSLEDGNYDDVRSNVSIDFAFEVGTPDDGDTDDDDTTNDTVCDENDPDAVDENGDPCNDDGDTTNDTVCDENAPMPSTRTAIRATTKRSRPRSKVKWRRTSRSRSPDRPRWRGSTARSWSSFSAHGSSSPRCGCGLASHDRLTPGNAAPPDGHFPRGLSAGRAFDR